MNICRKGNTTNIGGEGAGVPGGAVRVARAGGGARGGPGHLLQVPAGHVRAARYQGGGVAEEFEEAGGVGVKRRRKSEV